MKYFSLTSTLLFCSLVLFSCKKDNPIVPLPPEPPKSVTLSLIDVSCTEAFIKVTAADSVLPLVISLMKDDIVFTNFTLTKTDTVVIDTTLQPDHIYTYQTTETINGKEEKSDTLQVKTLNITSDNYTWQTYFLGDAINGSSIIKKVLIIDNNQIWAIGTIFLVDSAGQPDPYPYSLAKWDGISWKYKKLYYNNSYINSATDMLILDSNNIWIASGSIFHWDGSSQSVQLVFSRLRFSDPNATLEDFWGKQGSAIYCVGKAGAIAGFVGSNWYALDSGTNLNLNDIYGYSDETTGEQTILAAGGNILEGTERIILRIKDNQVQVISTAGTMEYPLGSVWLHNSYKYYFAGPGFYSKYYNQNNWQQSPTPYYYIYSMRGNKLNDIIVTGGKGYVGHFNGVNWTNYIGNGLEETSGNYYSASIKGNTAVVAGDLGDGRAIVVIGSR